MSKVFQGILEYCTMDWCLPIFPISLMDYINNNQWKQLLAEEFNKPYIKQIEYKITNHLIDLDIIYPPLNLIFHALNVTPLETTRAVIVAQDPYPGGQATGDAFSVHMADPVSRSLDNIFKLFQMIIPGFQIPNHGCLDPWASNGVLLLNSILTVTAGKPMSHKTYGWQELTNAIIRIISEKCNGVVFILFGSIAKQKEGLIDKNKHTIYTFPHPSPRSMSSFLKGPLVPYPIDAPISQINWTLPIPNPFLS
ncbi:uracil-DNA glycosylase-like [Saccostrea cucullata]|uniref:uracil-DNA glycosylase-like n=1 Tax=Saccostrea cuccullata TaxID=36930 RepID=UPI002ED61A65